MLTLLLHALILGGIYVGQPLAPPPVEARNEAPIEFVFTPKPAAESTPTRDADRPTAFTELPPDRKDKAPDHADLLSNVTSRARQETPSDRDTGMPRMTGNSDFPQVALSPGGASVQPREEQPREKTPPPVSETPALQPGGDQKQPEDSRGTATPEAPTIHKTAPEPEKTLAPADLDKYRLISPLANYDILQDAMNNPGGGSLLAGGISLNTVAWPYAPWLQRFTRDFRSRWYAPYAYRMGMIHGSHVLELEIAPDGRLLRMDLVEAEGDTALVSTSELTFQSMVPFHPLPADFPKATLILRIRLVYPDFREEWHRLEEHRQTEAPERPRRRGGRR